MIYVRFGTYMIYDSLDYSLAAWIHRAHNSRLTDSSRSRHTERVRAEQDRISFASTFSSSENAQTTRRTIQ